jgi:hypothetical protein
MNVPEKALTIRQPYVEAILREWKRYELRSVRTKFRGEFVVHSAKKRHYNPGLEAVYAWHGLKTQSLPIGYGLGVARIVDCIHISELDFPESDRPFYPPGFGVWAWELEVVTRWAKPIAAKGALGFWRWGKEKTA